MRKAFEQGVLYVSVAILCNTLFALCGSLDNSFIQKHRLWGGRLTLVTSQVIGSIQPLKGHIVLSFCKVNWFTDLSTLSSSSEVIVSLLYIFPIISMDIGFPGILTDASASLSQLNSSGCIDVRRIRVRRRFTWIFQTQPCLVKRIKYKILQIFENKP